MLVQVQDYTEQQDAKMILLQFRELESLTLAPYEVTYFTADE
jgi:hypothetical protein